MNRKDKVKAKRAYIICNWLDYIKARLVEGKPYREACEQAAQLVSKIIAEKPQERDFIVSCWKEMFDSINNEIDKVKNQPTS